MKLKNSYILLIAMSLFLLVSIGSVCASDMAMDANTQLANDGSDSVVLADESDASSSDDTVTKINTTVVSENVIIKESETANIPVTVKDNESQIIEITNNDLKVVEGTKNVKFEYNNSEIIITDKLSAGNHSLIINYLGNANYTNSATNIILSIIGNKTITEAPSYVALDDASVKIPIVVSNGVNVFDVTKDELTLNLTCKFENGNKSSKLIEDFVVENNTIKFSLDNTKFVTANLLITYTAEGESSKNVGIRLPSKINAESITVRDTENKTLKIYVSDNETELNVKKANLKVVEGSKSLGFTYADSAITITDSLTKGKHNIMITYKGNDTYAESTTNCTVSVYGNLTIEAPSSVNVNSTKKVEVKINITNGLTPIEFTKDSIDLLVTYKNGNDTELLKIKDIEVVNGTIKFEILNGDFTTANLDITYMNNTYNNVTLNRIYNIKVTPINAVTYYGEGNFTFKVVDMDDETLSLVNRSVTIALKNSAGTQVYFITHTGEQYIMNTDITVKINQDGIITLENKDFYPGFRFIINNVIYAPANNYTATVTGSGALKGNSSSNIEIKFVNANVKLETYNEYYGSDKKLTITVTNSVTGNPVGGVYILVNITGATLTTPNQITNEKGQIELGASGLPPSAYDVKLTTNDTNLINNTVSGSFTVKRIPLSVSAKDVTIYYNTGTTSSIKVIDKRTNKALKNAYVVFTIGSNPYSGITDKNGAITITLPLGVGKYKFTVTNVYMIDNDTLKDVYQFSKVSKTITVKKASGKIVAPKVKTYYKGGKIFIVKLVNTKNNKAIYGAKLNVKIYISAYSYYNYNGQTGLDGKLRISLDSFTPKTYYVVVSAGESKNFTAKQVISQFVILKAPAKLITNKVSAKQGTTKYFKVAVKNTKTKKGISGVKVKIKLYKGKNTKTYTVKTNAKGIAQLNVNALKVGTYKVAVASANKYVTAKTAKSKIVITK